MLFLIQISVADHYKSAYSITDLLFCNTLQLKPLFCFSYFLFSSPVEIVEILICIDLDEISRYGDAMDGVSVKLSVTYCDPHVFISFSRIGQYVLEFIILKVQRSALLQE